MWRQSQSQDESGEVTGERNKSHPYLTLRRLVRDAFRDILELRGRVDSIEKNARISEAERNMQPKLQIMEAIDEIGIACNFLKKNVSPWHKARFQLLVSPSQMLASEDNTFEDFSQTGSSRRLKKRTRNGFLARITGIIKGNALSLQSAEIVIPTYIQNLKVKLLPVTDSGSKLTSGISEHGIGNLVDNFVTPAGSASIPLLDSMKGHGIAIGMETLQNRLLVTAATLLHAKCGDSGEEYLSSAFEAGQSSANDKNSPCSFISEAAMRFSSQIALGLVGVYNTDVILNSSEYSRNRNQRCDGCSVGLHGLALLRDSICLRGWFSRSLGLHRDNDGSIGRPKGFDDRFGLSMSSFSMYDDFRIGAAIGSSTPSLCSLNVENGGSRKTLSKRSKILDYACHHKLHGEAFAVFPVNDKLTVTPNVTVNVSDDGKAKILFHFRINSCL